MSTEDELIKRAQSGDREAFCGLTRTYQRRIYSLALYYTRNPMDAEDLSQEVWLKAYRALPDFKGEASFYTWLRQITVNTLLNQQRSHFWAVGKTSSDRLSLEDVELPLHIEQSLHQRMLVDQVFQALGDLSARERLIFLLKHREGMTYDEIASTCGVSVGTIKKALFRTVTKLREQLGIRSGASEEAPLSRKLCEFPEGRGANC
ncbi:MAG: sigma-70 family RNA polymerase sigma factor [Acidobacteria bacterium]|nr:sigma-70 family RNA polymerase sigma factor [Acidobacteriota bacterium]